MFTPALLHAWLVKITTSCSNNNNFINVLWHLLDTVCTFNLCYVFSAHRTRTFKLKPRELTDLSYNDGDTILYWVTKLFASKICVNHWLIRHINCVFTIFHYIGLSVQVTSFLRNFLFILRVITRAPVHSFCDPTEVQKLERGMKGQFSNLENMIKLPFLKIFQGLVFFGKITNYFGC